jgi:hypothetical protein
MNAATLTHRTRPDGVIEWTLSLNREQQLAMTPERLAIIQGLLRALALAIAVPDDLVAALEKSPPKS